MQESPALVLILVLMNSLNCPSPEDGLIDVHLTAAQFIHSKNEKAAKELLSGIENDAAAYVYYQMGSTSEAESIGSNVYR